MLDRNRHGRGVVLFIYNSIMLYFQGFLDLNLLLLLEITLNFVQQSWLSNLISTFYMTLM